MKTKWLLRISVLALLPLVLSTLVISLISFEWWLADSDKFAQMFLTGTFNRPFSVGLFGTGIISLAITITSVLSLSKYAPKIDKLDDATMAYYDETIKYSEAKNKLINQADTEDDNTFIINALNAYWNEANKKLQQPDLGDIERKNYEYQLTHSKRLLSKKLKISYDKI